VKFPDLDPYLPYCHWGAFGIRWYALAYVAGILLGWRYVSKLIRQPRIWGEITPPLTKAQIDDLVLWVTLGVVLGGRLGYVAFYALVDPIRRQMLLQDPVEIFQTWHGGMSFHGGLIGVTFAVMMFSRFTRISPIQISDLIAPAVPIGLFFGRVANFINGELWGRKTDAPWGVIFCNNTIKRLSDGICPAGTDMRHPSQLYEAGLEGIALFLILRLATHRLNWLNSKGRVTGLFLTGYALARIALENVREPDPGLPTLPAGLTMGMALSAPMLLAGAWLLWSTFKADATLKLRL
jgi:phosphatidylglycerol---prolipoprotein diacylglyceryl transferase